jgi:hypothetical protein
MTTSKIILAVCVAATLFAGEASAKGCLTGAAVGGTAGHFAGHHAVLGAGVGCLIGRHRANKKDRAAAAQAKQTAVASSQTSVPTAPAQHR